jgi:hypothetical protein
MITAERYCDRIKTFEEATAREAAFSLPKQVYRKNYIEL